MSLSVNDFFTEYQRRELKEIVLTTWRGESEGVLFLRALSRSQVIRFRDVHSRAFQKKALDLITEEHENDGYENVITRTENYLLKNSIADETGKLILDDDEKLNKFNDMVPPAVVNEILCHIENFNELYGDFDGKESVEDSYKKK